MAAKEGLRRIVKVISILAWTCLIVIGVVAILTLFGGDIFLFWIEVAIAIVTFAAIQGIAWIIAGFSGNPKESDGLIRWNNPMHRQRRQKAIPAPRPDLVGVDGWLSWLSICLLVFGPLVLLGAVLGDIDNTERLHPLLKSLASWEGFKILYWSITAIACAVSIAAGYRLRRVLEPASVQFAKIALWVVGPGFVVAEVAIVYWSFGVSVGANVIGGFIGPFIGSAITAGLWTLYLKWSRRVQNTYFHGLNTFSAGGGPTSNRREPSL